MRDLLYWLAYIAACTVIAYVTGRVSGWLHARRQVRRRLPVHWLTDEERRRRARRWS